MVLADRRIIPVTLTNATRHLPHPFATIILTIILDHTT